jgi:cytochrome oxidase Cu insertion factor (SCO1/SenC/PrrC family)
MTGKGTSDPLWKMFGSMNNNRLKTPLYVLIDPRGIIRYAGYGGKDLSDLVEKIKQLVKNENFFAHFYVL